MPASAPLKSTPPAAQLAPELRLQLFNDMLLVRQTEERIRALYPEGDMRCPTHFSIGQEAVSAGVSAHLTPKDYAISAHRSHAHYMNKGGNLRAMLAEMYGKETGCATGRGGSMHLIDLSVNFLGCVPIIGSTIPIGVGAAFGAKLQHNDALTVIYFGDGATESGVLHESMNYAAIQKLKILFVCENNLYSVLTPLADRQPEGRKIIDLAYGHGIPAVQVDGQAVETAYTETGKMIDSIRAGNGPGFMEFATYRWLEHCGPNLDLGLNYRPEGEYERWTARCPVRLQKDALIRDGILSEAAYEQAVAKVDAHVEDAVTFAKQSPFPKRETLSRYMYAGQS